jgi:hypothetical protein
LRLAAGAAALPAVSRLAWAQAYPALADLALKARAAAFVNYELWTGEQDFDLGFNIRWFAASLMTSAGSPVWKCMS